MYLGINGVWRVIIIIIQGKFHTCGAKPRQVAVGETRASTEKQLNTFKGLAKMKI